MVPLIVPSLINASHSQFSDTTRKMCYQILLSFSKFDESIKQIPSFKELDAKFKQRQERDEQMEVEKKKRMKQQKSGLRLLDFGLGKVLGEGSYSVVRWAVRIEPSVEQRFWEEYALKIMYKNLLEEQNYVEQAQQEMEMLSKFQHENIISCISVFEDEKRHFLLLEYAHRGDVFSLLEGMGSLEENYASFVIFELVKALEYIHSQGFVHLDVKPEVNSFLFADNRIS